MHSRKGIWRFSIGMYDMEITNLWSLCLEEIWYLWYAIVHFYYDGFGIWKSTKQTFITFLTRVSRKTIKYGINFSIDDTQSVKTIHYLNVTLYIDENNDINFKSYTNPTYSKQYLRAESFHTKPCLNQYHIHRWSRFLKETQPNKRRQQEWKR